MKRRHAAALAAALALLVGEAEAAQVGDEVPGPAPAPVVLHLPPDAFAEGGRLGALQLERCSLVLADGEGASALRVSPAMAGRGFPDLAFTFPPYRSEYDLGLGVAAVRVRIPGGGDGGAATTLRSRSFAVRVAGAHLVLEVRFESEGREFVGDVSLDSPLTGAVPWRHFLDVEADDLVVVADLPLEARGPLVAVGEISVDVDVTLALTVTGELAVMVEGEALRQYVVTAARERLGAALNAPAFRGALGAVLGAVVLGDPSVAGRPVRRIELAEAADGGLDLRLLSAVPAAAPP